MIYRRIIDIPLLNDIYKVKSLIIITKIHVRLIM